MTIKTILAAASGGSASDGAIELACRFARRFGAHLEGFHARPDPRDLFTYSSDGFGMSMSGEFVDRFVKDAEEIVGKTKASFEAIAKRRSMKERTALGRRFSICRSASLTPVRLSVSAIEKKAIATVIISRGSAKRRTQPMKPGFCQGSGIATPEPPAVTSP